jgi:hypothetical protein
VEPDKVRRKWTRHGHCEGGKWTREYRSYLCMLTRCYQKDSGSYERYGGRGITVCDRWRKSFADFLADVGNAPSKEHQLDRVDPDGNYEPGNARWLHRLDNVRRRRNSAKVVLHGREVYLAEECARLGLNLDRVRARLSRGMPPERALVPGLLKTGPKSGVAGVARTPEEAVRMVENARGR